MAAVRSASLEATAAPLDAELALEAVTSSEATLELKLQAIEADKQMIILLVEMESRICIFGGELQERGCSCCGWEGVCCFESSFDSGRR